MTSLCCATGQMERRLTAALLPVAARSQGHVVAWDRSLLPWASCRSCCSCSKVHCTGHGLVAEEQTGSGTAVAGQVYFG